MKHKGNVPVPRIKTIILFPNSFDGEITELGKEVKIIEDSHHHQYEKVGFMSGEVKGPTHRLVSLGDDCSVVFWIVIEHAILVVRGIATRFVEVLHDLS